jgi:hypothetical protein
MYRSVVVEELLSWADALLPLDILSTLIRYSWLYLPLLSINEIFRPVRGLQHISGVKDRPGVKCVNT